MIDDPKLGQRDGSQLKISIGYRLTTQSGETILEDTEERAYTAFEDTPSGAKKFDAVHGREPHSHRAGRL